MADDDTKAEDVALGTFDATKKKKKKKPKEDAEEGADEVGELSEKVSEMKVGDAEDGAVAMDFGKKKKKKKPKEGTEGEGDGDDAAEEAEEEEGAAGEALLLTKKKKKKKQRAVDDELPDEAEQPAEGQEGATADDNEHVPDDGDDTFDEEAQGIELGGPVKLPWEGSDRDYLYEELLGRVFDILRQNNPELAGDRRRTIMRPPQVLREGTKKTVFVNFMDLCKIMHRQPEHVMSFLLSELGTSGSLDGQQRLVVKGRFAPKNFEGLLRRYINEYVMCNGCKSPDTILSKENRLHFVRCEQCGSHRSVAPIKAGFQARIGKRERTG